MTTNERYLEIIADAERLCEVGANENPAMVLGAITQRFAVFVNDIDEESPLKSVERDARDEDAQFAKKKGRK